MYIYVTREFKEHRPQDEVAFDRDPRAQETMVAVHMLATARFTGIIALTKTIFSYYIRCAYGFVLSFGYIYGILVIVFMWFIYSKLYHVNCYAGFIDVITKMDRSYISLDIWVPQSPIDDKWTLVKVISKTTTHYLRQRWHRSIYSYGVIRPQWALTCAQSFVLSLYHLCLLD